ncbi:MAG TPA: hypothetical protein PKM50_05145 [Methanoregula sp.]|nr:hypothetical protein [Methanoregula sp.]
MGRDSVKRQQEKALSEVIGFVLILGIITAVFSLYLVYGVPAQGRENEITHMNEVKDQFVAYKIGLDSLWVNHETGTTLSNTFSQGTGGGYTQGSNSIIPILSPVSSSGIIAINQRGTENLTITSQSLILNSTIKNTILINVSQSKLISSVPQHIYLNVTGVSSSDLTKDAIYGAQIKGTDSAGKTWIAQVNLTPRTVHYNETSSFSCTTTKDGTECTPKTYVPKTDYTGTDLTLTVIKSGSVSLQDFVINKNVTPNNYVIDIMDDAYGLNNFIGTSSYPVTLTLSKSQSLLQDITTTGLVVFGYNESRYTNSVTMGSLEYRAKNNYWIPQTYYYQLGGVFLYQPTENGTTAKLPPEITFTYNNDIVTVKVNAILIDQASTGLVGGNSPVQIKTTLENETALPYVTGLSGNTRWITIAVDTPDPVAKTMWQNYFNTTARSAGIPDSYYSTTTQGNTTIIRISGNTSVDYGVNVIAQSSTCSAKVHGIGGAVQ